MNFILDKKQAWNMSIEILEFVKLASFKGDLFYMSKKLEKLIDKENYTESLQAHGILSATFPVTIQCHFYIYAKCPIYLICHVLFI